jgi:hypothetical protein
MKGTGQFIPNGTFTFQETLHSKKDLPVHPASLSNVVRV